MSIEREPKSSNTEKLRFEKAEIRRSFEVYRQFHQRLERIQGLRNRAEIFRHAREIASRMVGGVASQVILRGELSTLEIPNLNEVPSHLEGLLPELGKDLMDWAVENRTASSLPIDEPELLEKEVHTQVIVPIASHSNVQGLMVLWSRSEISTLSHIELDMLSTLGRVVGIQIENATLYAEIQEIGSLLDNVLESIPYAVLVTNLDDQIVTMNSNAEFMFDLRRFFTLQEKYQRVMSPEVAAVFGKLVISTLKGEEQFDYEFQHRIGDRTDILIGISTSIVYDRKNNPTGIVFICRDLALSREVQKLRELDVMKTEFLHTVSHELKTPLTAIMGGTEVLLYDLETFSPDNQEIIQIIQEGGHRLHTLITDLLDLSRLESGNVDLALSRGKISDLVQDSMRILDPGTECNLCFQCDENEPSFLFDHEKIRQVVDNLISNATKYSPDGGTIQIRVYLSDDNERVHFEVTDEGIGIPPDQIEQIWNKFYRVDSSSTSEIEGTGLGLSITRHIILMHQGHIQATSQAGTGSTFMFWIPHIQEGTIL